MYKKDVPLREREREEVEVARVREAEWLVNAVVMNPKIYIAIGKAAPWSTAHTQPRRSRRMSRVRT